MLTFPVGELADRCLNAWLDITDEGFSHAILPSTQLAERFSTLMESDADLIKYAREIVHGDMLIDW